ncbi:MAG: peroxiredoxin [Rickettsiaceae bacterium]|nr:peroxiredoxin [Rickettsiaceae bacterium]
MQNIFTGKSAPNFIAKAIMHDNSINQEFSLSDYCSGEKCVLFFYPLNFTFVCPSEIISFNNHLSEFKARNTKIVAVSVDSHFSHLEWKRRPHNKGGIGDIQFPLVSDLSKSISKAYNVLGDDGFALRGTFFIDENFILRSFSVNDAPIGRNIEEILRTIDAWDHFSEHGEVCPAGWTKGKDAINATSEGIADYLASNADKL